MQRYLPARTLVFLALSLQLGCRTTPSTTPSSPTEAHPSTAGISEIPSAPTFPTSRRTRRRSRAAAVTAAPGDFDYYLLTLSWSPEYCATHPSSPECAAHPGFVVHGLWPQNNDGTYPEDCSNAPGPTNPQGDTDLQPTVSLVEHEWQTHGTCSGLAADAYFNTIRQAFHEITIPASLTHVQKQQTVAPQLLLQQFAAANPSIPANAFVLSCGNNYLTAVEVCLTKSLAGETCPNVKACGATVVKVTPQ